eukprot:PITA_32512
MVDPAKVTVILNLESPKNVKQLRATLRNTRYYRKFIKGYAQITMPMEELLKKYVMVCWDEDCQCSLDVLKENMVTSPILVFLKWKKEFHVHLDVYCIALGMEYDFELVVKPGRFNAAPDYLSRIEMGEEPNSLEERFPDAQRFVVHVVDDHFMDIIYFITMGTTPKGYSTQQKKELVVRALDFLVFAGHLYKIGMDEILRRYVPEFECVSIFVEAHGGEAGGHYIGKVTTQKILCARLW